MYSGMKLGLYFKGDEKVLMGFKEGSKLLNLCLGGNSSGMKDSCHNLTSIHAKTSQEIRIRSYSL